MQSPRLTGKCRALTSTHPGVHEDEVHLHEREHHLEDGVDAPEDHVARRGEGYFEERPEFQPVVYHGAQAEG